MQRDLRGIRCISSKRYNLCMYNLWKDMLTRTGFWGLEQIKRHSYIEQLERGSRDLKASGLILNTRMTKINLETIRKQQKSDQGGQAWTHEGEVMSDQPESPIHTVRWPGLWTRGQQCLSVTSTSKAFTTSKAQTKQLAKLLDLEGCNQWHEVQMSPGVCSRVQYCSQYYIQASLMTWMTLQTW